MKTIYGTTGCLDLKTNVWKITMQQKQTWTTLSNEKRNILFKNFFHSSKILRQQLLNYTKVQSPHPQQSHFFSSCLSCGCQKPQPLVFYCRLPHLNNLNRGRSASSCETSLHYVPLRTLVVLFDQNNCHCIKQDYTWLTAEAIRTTVVPISGVIRTTVVPISGVIGPTVVRIANTCNIGYRHDESIRFSYKLTNALNY